MARTKKSRSMRGKLGKTGSKEQLKEQRKAVKASSIRRFETKKNAQRKDQAQKKLERLGLAPVIEEKAVPPRARRFTFVAKPSEVEEIIKEEVVDESPTAYLMDAFTEPK